MYRVLTASPDRRPFLTVIVFITLFTFVLFRYSTAPAIPLQTSPLYSTADFEVNRPPEPPQTEPLDTTSSQAGPSITPVFKPEVTETPTSVSHATTYTQDAAVEHSPGATTPVTPIPSLATPTSTQSPRADWDELQDRIDKYIQWDRPTSDHWPAWQDYEYTNYDPNRWEGMERENGYFVENTVPQIEKQGAKPQVYLPYPQYNSDNWRTQWRGNYIPCPGPRGQNYAENLEHLVKSYPNSANNFPKESIGSASVLGLDQTVCFDRNTRYGPYGLGNPEEAKGPKRFSRMWKHLDWDYTGWGRLQDACFEMNQDRYEPRARVPMVLRPSKNIRRDVGQVSFIQRPHAVPKYHSRTAVLLRTWEGYEYQENDLQAIRALITELSLLSGGEYQVYLLVNVKQREADIYNDPVVYQDILKQVVPAELRDIAVLWTERVLEEWYPRVGDWQVYWMQFMPLQWFSKTHPEFDYIWNWETDARYIGNHYHFLEQIAAFAKSMPRKHLWERNSRFYIPEHHGSWENFLKDTDEAILRAKAEGVLDPVWGPQPYAPFQYPLGPEPPTPAHEDNFSWGVDEEADLITLQPIWDPSETSWSYRNHIWNYIPTVRPEFTPTNGNGDGIDNPGFPMIPRRVFINTQVRLSKRLLNAMHEENLQGRSMQAEMWPATVALQHGLKAVYAPHPIWTDRKWPAWYMDAVFNADNNITARWGQQDDSPYNHDREANFGGWSWYYRSVFPSVLYRRWLGWKAHDWGWDSQQAKDDEWKRVLDLGIWSNTNTATVEDDKKTATTTISDKEMLKKREDRVDVGGRMCLPGMLLHPVKNVRENADGG